MGGDEEGGVLGWRKVVLLIIGASMEVAVNEGESWRARNQPRFDVRVSSKFFALPLTITTTSTTN